MSTESPESVEITGLPTSYKDKLAKQLAEFQKKILPAGGDKIRITQDKQFMFPDSTSTREPFKCVIVDFGLAYDYYTEAYDATNITPPVCFSRGMEADSLVPSNNSPQKQAESCSECPNNQFRSAGRAKACRNSRQLAVVVQNGNEMDTMGPMWILQTSPTAVTAFDKYVSGLTTAYQTVPCGVLSTIGFDSNKTYPTVRFGRPVLLPEEVAAQFMARQEEAKVRLMQEPDISSFVQAAVKPARRRV